MEFLLDSHNWPFGSALVLLMLIAMFEGLGMLFGSSPSSWMEGLFPDLGDSALDSLGWLHVGKVPMLILLILFLTGFSLFGYISQSFWRALTGQWLYTVVAIIPAALAGLGSVRILGGWLAKIKIGDETRAVSGASLLGRSAAVVQGIASQSNAAQAKVKDEHGITHYVLIEPDLDHETFAEGTSVLLVRQVGARYFVIANPHPELI